MTKRIRFLMLGGFLGAGKTTAMGRLARSFTAQGKTVALITNDQANGLVDTQSLAAEGFSVGEVTGACFCCKFNDLVEKLKDASAAAPDVILAEPVGSCTDLVATVVEPLRRFYGDQFEVGPYAVLLKPEHGRKILDDVADSGFSAKAAYIFLKQLEEADIIVLNKIDKLSAEERKTLVDLTRARFPGKQVLCISARTGEHFDDFEKALSTAPVARGSSLEVDYDVYAEGEAELGWLNCNVAFVAKKDVISLDDVLLRFVELLDDAYRADGVEPAHLKVLASSEGNFGIANLVTSEGAAELSRSSGAVVQTAELAVNARIATDPDRIVRAVNEAAKSLAEERSLNYLIANMQAFRPGRPVPTHRLTAAL